LGIPAEVRSEKEGIAMKSNAALVDLESRAIDALKAVLGQVSVIKLKEMRREAHTEGRSVEILADIDVFGHTHLLACEVKTHGEPAQLRATLRNMRNDGASLAGNVTQVIIAPYLSPEAQQVCKESDAGFLDLEGNARLSFGEVFIGMRSMPGQSSNQSALIPRSVRSSSHRGATRTLPSDRAAAAAMSA
jgi:hypothetical protein